jgi:hypothetical protein
VQAHTEDLATPKSVSNVILGRTAARRVHLRALGAPGTSTPLKPELKVASHVRGAMNHSTAITANMYQPSLPPIVLPKDPPKAPSEHPPKPLLRDNPTLCAPSLLVTFLELEG